MVRQADYRRTGRVTYAALNLFVCEEVTRLTEGRQRPVFISPRGVPVFAVALVARRRSLSRLRNAAKAEASARVRH